MSIKVVFASDSRDWTSFIRVDGSEVLRIATSYFKLVLQSSSNQIIRKQEIAVRHLQLRITSPMFTEIPEIFIACGGEGCSINLRKLNKKILVVIRQFIISIINGWILKRIVMIYHVLLYYLYTCLSVCLSVCLSSIIQYISPFSIGRSSPCTSSNCLESDFSFVLLLLSPIYSRVLSV